MNDAVEETSVPRAQSGLSVSLVTDPGAMWFNCELGGWMIDNAYAVPQK
jgi:hypothetical protein